MRKYLKYWYLLNYCFRNKKFKLLRFFSFFYQTSHFHCRLNSHSAGAKFPVVGARKLGGKRTVAPPPFTCVLAVTVLVKADALEVKLPCTVIQPHQIFLPWKYLFFNKELKMSIYRRRIFLLFLIIFNSLMKKFKLLNGEVIFFFKYKVFIPIIGRETSSSWSRSFSALKRKRNFSYFSLILRHSPSFFIKEVLYVPLAGKAWNKSSFSSSACCNTCSEFNMAVVFQ